MYTVYLLSLLVAAAYAGVPACHTVYDEKCWDEPRQECRYVQKPYTTTVYEEECYMDYDSNCNTVYEDKVEYVPRQECHTVQVPKVTSVPEQKCKDVPEQKCHTTYEQECHTTYEEKCHTVYEKQCKTVTEKECSFVNGHQKCWDEPREKCWDEPRVILRDYEKGTTLNRTNLTVIDSLWKGHCISNDDCFYPVSVCDHGIGNWVTGECKVYEFNWVIGFFFLLLLFTCPICCLCWLEPFCCAVCTGLGQPDEGLNDGGCHQIVYTEDGEHNPLLQ